MAIPTQGELKIIILMPGEGESETANGKTPSATNPKREGGGGVAKNPKDGNSKSSITMQAAVHSTMQVGTQAINSAISVIGLSTGNYYAQARAQQTMQGISSLVSVGLSLASGNPLLIATTLASTAMTAGTEIYKQNREREIANYEAEQYAKRIGYTVGRR